MTTLSVINSTQGREVDIVLDDPVLAMRRYSRRNDKPLAMRTEQMLCLFRPSGVTSQLTIEEIDIQGHTSTLISEEESMGVPELFDWNLHEYLVAFDAVVAEAGWDRDT